MIVTLLDADEGVHRTGFKGGPTNSSRGRGDKGAPPREIILTSKKPLKGGGGLNPPNPPPPLDPPLSCTDTQVPIYGITIAE